MKLSISNKYSKYTRRKKSKHLKKHIRKKSDMLEKLTIKL